MHSLVLRFNVGLIVLMEGNKNLFILFHSLLFHVASDEHIGE